MAKIIDFMAGRSRRSKRHRPELDAPPPPNGRSLHDILRQPGDCLVTTRDIAPALGMTAAAFRRLAAIWGVHTFSRRDRSRFLYRLSDVQRMIRAERREASRKVRTFTAALRLLEGDWWRRRMTAPALLKQSDGTFTCQPPAMLPRYADRAFVFWADTQLDLRRRASQDRSVEQAEREKV